MPIPDLPTLLPRFRTRARSSSRPAASDMRAGRRQRRAFGDRGAMGLRRRTRGSALVVALMAGLVALIGALVLASRLFSSRFNSSSRSDTLAAREAAEYGLNEIQARLNSNEFAHLWVTRRNRWNAVDLAALKACQVAALDSNGDLATSLPALPAEVTGTRTIRTDAATGTTISYQLTDFEPPRLPDDATATTNQSQYCGNNSTAAANFGNLSGGSALITVQGTVSRGGRSNSFRLTRTTHVANSGGNELAYSFIILGDAYEDKTTKDGEKFGNKDDIANLNYLDGNICYGDITDTTCFTTPPLPKTVIGCFDLGSCLINNVFNNEQKDKLSKFCADVKAKKKKKGGYTCNEFQQIDADNLPSMITPASAGMVIDGADYSDSNWSSYSAEFDKCEAKKYRRNDYSDLTQDTYEWECEVKGGAPGSNPNANNPYKRVRFPYRSSVLPVDRNAALNLTNNDLLPGCYFSHINAARQDIKANSVAAPTRSINCLVRKLKIDNDGKLDNLIIYTANGANKLLPVNLFVHGSYGDKIELKDGGIEGNDTTDLGWSQLRVLGRPQATASGSSVSCRASSPIISKKGNDLNNLWVWLPNSALIYDKKSTKDNAYVVVWACMFEGPKKEKDKDPYSIITPIPEQLVRAGLSSTLGSSFIKTAATGVFRGYGSEDAPAQ